MVSSLLKAARKAAKEAKDLRKQTKDVLTKPKQTPQGTGQQEFTQTRKAYKLFVQRDDGGLYPLFVDADTRIPENVFTEANFPKEAFTAPNGRLYVPSKGAKRGKGEKKKGTGVQIIVPDEKTRNMLKDAGYSVSKPKEGAEHGTVLAVAARPGYHASQKPVATHIGPQDIKITNAEAKKLLKAGITPEAIKKRKGQLYVKRRAEDQVFAEVEMADDVNYEQILKDAGKTDINDRVPVGGSYRYVDGQADSDFWVVGGNMKVNRVLSRDEVKTIQQQEGVKDLPYKEEVESILGKKFAEGGLLEGDDMQQGIDDYVVAKTESETMDMNVGGTPKKNLEAQQLEMFGDIGMAKSPAKKDPVSGNEIPKASTAEEVRDDIPARLSEGEFVLPADVVRYHGLEKLMNLRQQAKQGINTMDKMGQLGNAEEATMPDDLPFDVNDIEMQEGGFVNPTGTYQVPSNIATTPSYFQNYAQTTAPFTPFVPPKQTAIPPIAPVTPPKTTGPTFQTLIPSEGQRPVTKEYRNAAGQKLFIPFINNKPIYPIPEGYTEYKEEEAVKPDTAPKPQTTSVRTQADGGDSDVLSGTSQVRGIDNSIVSTDFAKQTADKVAENLGKMSASDRAVSVMDAVDKSKGYTGLAKGLQQAGRGFLTVTNPLATVATMVAGKTVNPLDIYSSIRDTGKPDMGARDAITGAFGYSATSFADPSGRIDDPIADARSEQNAINTAIFGGIITGTENVTRGGIQGITDRDIQNAFGIAPDRDKMGFISRGTNPGQISSTGTYYDSGGVGTDPDKAEYSSISDMLGYLSNAAKNGYVGTKGRAREQAKQGNKAAIATLKAEAIREKSIKDKVAVRDPSGGIGEDKGPGSQTIGIESDVQGIADQTAVDTSGIDTSGIGQGVGATGGLGGPGGVGGIDYGGIDESNQPSGDDDDPGGVGGGGDSFGGLDFKQGGLAKRKTKVKKMKRGGLASR
tara:strand:- start:1445 stop:4348 length:2904 start_codon:yes stop_codon:yes gene_type:complete